MHDLKRIRHDFETVYQGVMKRGKGDFGLLRIQELEVKRREILQDLEAKKNQSNVKSRQVPVLKKAGQDATELLAELKTLSGEIGTLEAEVKAVEDEVTQLLYLVPNVPHDDIPVGQGEDDNVELRRWGSPGYLISNPSRIGTLEQNVTGWTSTAVPRWSVPALLSLKKNWPS